MDRQPFHQDDRQAQCVRSQPGDSVIARSDFDRCNVLQFSAGEVESISSFGSFDLQALVTHRAVDRAEPWLALETPLDRARARDLERVFSQLEPDWEGSLSRIFGDVWGHQVATGLRSGASYAKETVSTAGELVDEYLKSARGPVVLADEFAEFADTVDELGETGDRISERLDALEKAREEQS